MCHPSPWWEVFVQLSNGACRGEALSPPHSLGFFVGGVCGGNQWSDSQKKKKKAYITPTTTQKQQHAPDKEVNDSPNNK